MRLWTPMRWNFTAIGVLEHPSPLSRASRSADVRPSPSIWEARKRLSRRYAPDRRPTVPCSPHEPDHELAHADPEIPRRELRTEPVDSDVKEDEPSQRPDDRPDHHVPGPMVRVPMRPPHRRSARSGPKGGHRQSRRQGPGRSPGRRECWDAGPSAPGLWGLLSVPARTSGLLEREDTV